MLVLTVLESNWQWLHAAGPYQKRHRSHDDVMMSSHRSLHCSCGDSRNGYIVPVTSRRYRLPHDRAYRFSDASLLLPRPSMFVRTRFTSRRSARRITSISPPPPRADLVKRRPSSAALAASLAMRGGHQSKRHRGVFRKSSRRRDDIATYRLCQQFNRRSKALISKEGPLRATFPSLGSSRR